MSPELQLRAGLIHTADVSGTFMQHVWVWADPLECCHMIKYTIEITLHLYPGLPCTSIRFFLTSQSAGTVPATTLLWTWQWSKQRTYFIKDDKRLGGSIGQNVGSFWHLHVKRRHVSGNIITGSDSGKEAVHHTHHSLLRRDKATHLRGKQRILGSCGKEKATVYIVYAQINQHWEKQADMETGICWLLL